MKFFPRYILVYLIAMAGLSTTYAQKLSFNGPFTAGRLPTSGLDETSGLVASQMNSGVLWTHNDSGDGPFIYALSAQAEVLCTVRVQNATNRDWEDIAHGPGPKPGTDYLYVCISH
jgi:hypothetical protein